jgi:hypothetical protein
MANTPREWRRNARSRAQRLRAANRRIKFVRRRFKVFNRARPPVRRLVMLGLAVFAGTVLGGAAILAVRPTGLGGGAPNSPVPKLETAKLSERRLEDRIRVIDGDTIEAAGERIRIANIDTPEMPPKSRCAAEAILAGRATSGSHDGGRL